MPAELAVQAALRGRVREELIQRVDECAQVRLALVTAPGGSGKSTLLRCWRERLVAQRTATAWLELGVLHDDPSILVEDLVGAVRRATNLPDLAADTLAELGHLKADSAPTLSRRLIATFGMLSEPVVIFLDNFHLLAQREVSAQLIDLLLRSEDTPLHFAVASRGVRPACTPRLLAEDAAFEISANDLSLRSDQVSEVLASRAVTSNDISTLLLARTRGWATAVQLAARALERIPEHEHEAFLRSLDRHRDLFDFMANDLIGGESEEMLGLLECAALCGPLAPRDLATVSGLPDALRHIETAASKGLLTYVDDRVGLHDLWSELLERRLDEQLDDEQRRRLFGRIGHAMQPYDVERALRLLVRAEDHEQVVAILEQHGRAWFNAGRLGFIENWVSRLPDDVLQKSIDLLYLQALNLGRRDPRSAVAAFETLAKRFAAAGDRSGEWEALADAWVIAQNNNLTDAMQRLLPRRLSLRRLATDPEARALGAIVVAMLASSRNRHALAERILLRLRGPGRSVLGRTSVVMGLTVLGRYRNQQQTLEILEEVTVDPDFVPHALSHRLFVAMRALLRGLRGIDAERGMVEAESSAQAFADFGMGVSEMACHDAVGKLARSLGRREEALSAFQRAVSAANEVGQSSYASTACGQAILELLALGRESEARDLAQDLTRLLEGASPQAANPTSLRFTELVAWRALAECGQAPEAFAGAQQRESSYRSPDLPIASFQSAVLMARIAELAGRVSERDQQLQRARTYRESCGPEAIAPEIDPELALWLAGALPDSPIEPGNAADVPSASWEVVTLGGFQVTCSGARVPDTAWRGATPRRLLLRLLAAGGSERRERLQSDLWPESDAKRGGSSLRVALTRLRSAIGSDAVQSQGDHLALAPELLAGWDVERVSNAQGLELAALYAGPFAPDLYEDWAEDLRRDIEGRVLAALATAARQRLGEAPAEALVLATRLREIAPLDEEGWILSARGEAAGGDQAAARRLLAQGRAALLREFESEPSRDFRALEQELGS